MDLSALLERYQTLLPWNLARTKCFVSMILGMIASESVQQHKAALGFVGVAKQKSVCARIRNFLKSFNFNFTWNHGKIYALLAPLRHKQGRFVGRMESLCFQFKEQAILQTLTQDVLKSSEIEGEILDTQGDLIQIKFV